MKEKQKKVPAEAVLQAYMARTTALLNGKTTSPLAEALRKSYGAVVGVLKTHPEFLDQLMEEIAGLREGMPAEWYLEAIRAKVRVLRPGPRSSTVHTILQAAAKAVAPSGTPLDS